MPSASRSGTGLAVPLDLLPVDLRELRLRIELVRVALVDGARTDVLGLRDLLPAGQLHRELGAEPAPLGEAVMRLGDQGALPDGVGRLGRDVVGEDRGLPVRRRRLAAAVVEHALALRGVD